MRKLLFALLASVVPPSQAADALAEQITDAIVSRIFIDTSRVTGLSGNGKIFFWMDGGVLGQSCGNIDLSLLQNQSCVVIAATSTGTTRPMFDIAKYQACQIDPNITDKNKCTVAPYWVGVGNVAVGTPCEPPIIRGSGANEYRKTTNGTVSGAAGCRCTTGTGFQAVPRESVAVYRKRYPAKDLSPEDDAICKAVFTTPPPVVSDDHTFCVSSDDGGRLTVNGIKVVDNWVEQNETKVCGTMKLAPGTYPILAEMFDSGGNAAFKVFMDGNIITPANLPTGGWDCSYFNTREPTGVAVLKRLEPSLNFTWGTASPGPGVNPDNFSLGCVSSLRLP